MVLRLGKRGLRHFPVPTSLPQAQPDAGERVGTARRVGHRIPPALCLLAYAATAQSLPRFPSAGSLPGFPGTGRVINPSFGYPKDSETPPGRSHGASRPMCQGWSRRLARHRFSRKQRDSPTRPWGPVPSPSMAGDIWSQPPAVFQAPDFPIPSPGYGSVAIREPTATPGGRTGVV